MTEISDLKRRVEAVGEKFGRLAEQENRYGERLSGLLNAVEEGFARSQKETQALKTELETARDELKRLMRDVETAREEARRHRSELDGVKGEREALLSQLDGAKGESRQLRGMLLTLLEAVESGGNLDIGAAMRKLESRIDRIVTSNEGDVDVEPAPAAKLYESFEPAPREAAPVQDEWDTVDEDTVDLTAEEQPAEPLTLVTTAPDDDGVELADVVHEVVVLAAESDTHAEFEKPEDLEAFAEPEKPLETEEPEEPKKHSAPVARTAEPPSDDDLSAVNKIIQRISLLTGEFVETSHKRPDAGQEKAVPSLKIGNGADDTDSPDDESSAKTS